VNCATCYLNSPVQGHYSLGVTDTCESLYAQRRQFVFYDTKEDRAHLIIDTKWKNYEGSMSDARQADAYQVHAYATTYSKHYKTPKGIDKTYYPPVCLLYLSIGSARAPDQGRFTGTNSLFILASAPMDKDNYQFDPSVVLGDEWP
jgi:McrBC 5-methylcytosine restriction system component